MIDFSCKRFEVEEIIKCALSLTKTEVKIFLSLRDEEAFLTTREIAQKMKIDLTTAQKAVKKFTDQDVIEKRQENLNGGGYQYVYQLKNKSVITQLIMEKVNHWVSFVKKELCR